MQDVYQEVILEHNKSPRNFRVLEKPSRVVHGDNPLCGDSITLFLQLDPQGRVEEISFQGSGCAISKASASMMTQAVKGKTEAEARKLFGEFHALVTGHAGAEPAEAPSLGKLAAFAGVAQFPARVKCASLAWHTLTAALDQKDGTVSTE